MERAADNGRVFLQLQPRPEIENCQPLALLLLVSQLVHGDSRHAQLAQQAVSLEVFVTDVKRSQPGNQPDRTAAEAAERSYDLFQLVAEQDPCQYKTSSVKQRPRCVEKKESRGAYSRISRHRWRQGAQARNEFGRNDTFHPVSREH